jgi:hypothetical protein
MFNRWKEELYLGQQQLARAISAASHGFVGAIRAAVNPPAEKVKPDLEEPFVPDGVFGGIPYRVLPSGSIDAMMPGGMVRFRNMDQLLAAADRNQTLSSVPRTEPKKPSTKSTLLAVQIGSERLGGWESLFPFWRCCF